MRELDVARKAAEKGGQIVAKYFHEGVTIRTKESYNLVSDADLESEQAIVDVIRSGFSRSRRARRRVAPRGHYERALVDH